MSPVTELVQLPAVFLPSPAWTQTSHVEGSHVLGTILLGDEDRDNVKPLPGGHCVTLRVPRIREGRDRSCGLGEGRGERRKARLILRLAWLLKL